MTSRSSSMARRLAPAGLIAMLFGAVALLSLWLWSTRSYDVAPVSLDATPVVAAEGERPADSSPVVAIPQREAVAAGYARVMGVVFDGQGVPMAGAPVTLQRAKGREQPRQQPLELPGIVANRPPIKHTHFYPLQQATTDVHGAFAFDDLEPADYTASIALTGAPAAEKFSLASGQTRRCELRLAKDTAIVFGEVRQGGVLVPHRTVLIRGKGQHTELPVTADDRGTYRSVVLPGPCLVQVCNHLEGSPAGTSRLVVCERTVLVLAGPPVRCDLDVPDCRLEVQIDEGAGSQVAGLEFEIASADAESGGAVRAIRQVAGLEFGIAGAAAERGGSVRAIRAAPDGRSCVFGDLACGTWSVLVRAPCLLPGEPHRIQLTARAPHAFVRLPVRPAGIVRVVARNLAGEAMVLAPAGPVLVTSRGELVGADLGRAGRGMVTSEDFGFVSVPPGRAELRLCDRQEAGRLLYLPFDAVPAQTIDVAPGDHNRIELRVERRALVRLRVVDSVGREEPGARITVLAGEREVHSTEQRPSRWRSHLPPDEYRMIVERGSGRSEQRLLVGRQDLELKLRP